MNTHTTILTRWNLADGGWMPLVPSVGVRTLHKDAGLALALCIHLSSHVEQVDSSADVPAGVLNLLVPVNVGQQAQTEPVLGAGVREAIHGQAGLGGLEDLTHSVLHLVVAHHTPIGRLCVSNGLIISGPVV